jgi:hypothetical protein
LIDNLTNRAKWGLVRDKKERARIECLKRQNREERCSELIRAALNFLTFKRAMQSYLVFKEERLRQYRLVFVVNMVKIKMRLWLRKLKPTAI